MVNYSKAKQEKRAFKARFYQTWYKASIWKGDFKISIQNNYQIKGHNPF